MFYLVVVAGVVARLMQVVVRSSVFFLFLHLAFAGGVDCGQCRDADGHSFASLTAPYLADTQDRHA